MKKAILFGFVVVLVAASTTFAQSYRGTFAMTSGGVTLTLTLNQDNSGRITGTLSSAKGTSFRLVGTITEGIATGSCTGDAGQSYFEAEFEGNKLIFTLVEVNAAGNGNSRSLEFVRVAEGSAKPAPPVARGEAATKPSAAPATIPTPPQAAAQADMSLLSYFAGEWYSYTGGSTIYGGAGTERTVTLCSDGQYRDSYEFSASGTGQWGGVNSQRGAARWSMQGDKTRGIITVTYANGQTKKIPLQILSKQEQTILLDGIKFVFAGAAKCR